MLDNLLLAHQNCFCWREVLPGRGVRKKQLSQIPHYWRYERNSKLHESAQPERFISDCTSIYYCNRLSIDKLCHAVRQYHHQWHCSMFETIPLSMYDHRSVPVNFVKTNFSKSNHSIYHPAITLRYAKKHELSQMSPFHYIGNKMITFQDVVDNDWFKYPTRLRILRDISIDKLLDFAVDLDNSEPNLVHSIAQLEQQFGLFQKVVPLSDKIATWLKI